MLSLIQINNETLILCNNGHIFGNAGNYCIISKTKFLLKMKKLKKREKTHFQK
jgi:hypothetical protein